MKINKKRHNTIEERYNSIMNVLARKVKRIIENCDNCDDEFDECDRFDECGDDEFDECDTFECNEGFRRNRMHRSSRLYEMAMNRSIDRKILANVRDKIARNGYDTPYGINWRKNVSLPRKYTPDELLQYYVAALLVYGEDCPQTEADIDSIGIFTNYAHKLIDEYGFTIDDIKDFYAQNDKIQSKSRRGSSRGSKAYRATKDNPSPDMDFDAEEVKTTANAEDEELPDKLDSDFDDIPDATPHDYTNALRNGKEKIDDPYKNSYDDNVGETEDVDETPSSNDFPSYDEVEPEEDVDDVDDEDVDADDEDADADDEDVDADDEDVDDESETPSSNDFPSYEEVDAEEDDDSSNNDGWEDDDDDDSSNNGGWEDDDDNDNSSNNGSWEDDDDDDDSSNNGGWEDDDDSGNNDRMIIDDEGDETDEDEDEDDIPDYDSVDVGDTWEAKKERELHPSEYTLIDLMNPNFSEVIHNYNPDNFLLDEDGRIGFDVYKYETITEANTGTISADRTKPSFTIWDKVPMRALAKVGYLCDEPTCSFGKCDKQTLALLKAVRNNKNSGFADFYNKYLSGIDNLRNTDPFFLNHKNRTSDGHIKIVGNDVDTVLEFFDKIDEKLPIEKLVNMPKGSFDDMDFDNITNVNSNDDLDDDLK